MARYSGSGRDVGGRLTPASAAQIILRSFLIVCHACVREGVLVVWNLSRLMDHDSTRTQFAGVCPLIP